MKKGQLLQMLISDKSLRTREVIAAFKKVPREKFVPKQYKKFAYADEPLPIGSGQTISAPSIVAIMTELLEPRKSDKVLEVGTGSGYQAAILSRLVKKVYTTEVYPELAENAKKAFSQLKYRNIEVIISDGSKGYAKAKPYDKIILTCACPEIPKALISQLKMNGRLVAPVGPEFRQELTLLVKTRKGNHMEYHGGCVFVPMRKTDIL